MRKMPGGRQTQAARTSLMRCACCLAGAELTRYDGWFLAGVMGAVVVVIVAAAMAESHLDDRALRQNALKFLLGIAVVPVLWLAYNRRRVWQRVGVRERPILGEGDRAARRRAESRAAQCQGRGHLFLEIGAVEYGGRELGPLLAGGGLRGAGNRSMETAARNRLPMLLLWVPLVFYALSIAYGSVPIHVHTWWPFATFNQRYGLQLLPMFAVSAGVLAASVFLACERLARAARWETGGGDVGAGGGQLCIGVEGGAAMPEGSAEELGNPESSECRGGADNRAHCPGTHAS